MSADIKNLKNLQNTEYSLKKLFDDAEDFLPNSEQIMSKLCW